MKNKTFLPLGITGRMGRTGRRPGYKKQKRELINLKESNNENFNNTLTKISMVLHSALRCTCAQISPLGLKNVPTSAQLLTNQKTWSFLYPI